jgi:hypothetical protein
LDDFESLVFQIPSQHILEYIGPEIADMCIVVYGWSTCIEPDRLVFIRDKIFNASRHGVVKLHNHTSQILSIYKNKTSPLITKARKFAVPL